MKMGDKLVILADTSADWVVMAMSCMFLKITFITIFPSLVDEFIKRCILSTQLKCLFLDRKSFRRLKPMLSELQTVTLILYSTIFREDTPKYEMFNAEFVTTRHIFDFEQTNERFLSSLPPSEPEDLAAIVFTSGSTGTPKGVMILQYNIVSSFGRADDRYFDRYPTYPAYLPLSHILEMVIELFGICSCCKIGYCNPGTLFESSPMLNPLSTPDLYLLKPDSMVVVPLILERIVHNFKAKLQASPRIKRIIFQTLYNVKAHFLQRGYSTYLIDKYFFQRFQNLFGGQIKCFFSGGSYLPKHIQEFVNIVFFQLFQGYGLTEACCGVTACPLGYQRTGSCGYPTSFSMFKLIPWPEGGFLESRTSLIKGEILISGPCVMPGDFGEEDLGRL
ncbi:Long-chain-fatty-acid--CoA ligase 4 [Thelohanellus kitauei]|uniref:long-chain-fatty-acid--CoA ligase n=1 Tax=Thelohanellus kitauei TaxID=669202 RepID=A0A0C2MX50_THEKT|nr:Long-chain-fatty-acid--CoA ligase 4 [Thelohanellus kitauei]